MRIQVANFYVDNNDDDEDMMVFRDAKEDDNDDSTTSTTTTATEEEEEEHPLGFAEWGKTRFALDREPVETLEQYKARWGYNFPEDEPQQLNTRIALSHNHLDYSITPTRTLMQYKIQNSSASSSNDNDDSMQQITQMLRAASLISDAEKARLIAPFQHGAPNLYDYGRVDYNRIQHHVNKERQQLDYEGQQAAKALTMLLHGYETRANNIRQDYKIQQSKQQEQERQVKEKQLELDKERQAKENLRAQEQEAILKAKNEHKQKLADKYKRENEHKIRAFKIMAQVEEVRKQIAPFDKLKSVSKRRLRMKKTTGKFNTLSDDENKIKSIAKEVVQEIALCRQEDDELKKQIAAGNTNITPDETRGKRYFLDFLCSKVVVRIQAEGFHGLRGDGASLACMLAHVASVEKDLVVMLAAHIYRVCPIAIPSLPDSSLSESEFMEGLGMIKDKDGNFETFPRFVTRTEGIISTVAYIMSARPSSHTLMGGHEAAVKWMSRFLKLLPLNTGDPLPIFTAPVLDAFLTGAGHMLANVHPNEFREHLKIINEQVVPSLDDSPTGKPSKVRLQNLLKGGFNGFQSTLPLKVLPNLYNRNASGSKGGNNDQMPESSVGSSNFNPSSTGAQSSMSSPFGAAPTNKSPFGGGTSDNNNSSITSNTFGSGTATSTPFGSTNVGNNSSNSTAFGSPFGNSIASTTPFGSNIADTSNSMQSNNDNMSSDPPGMSSNPFGTAQSTPFGNAAPSSTSFGNAASSSTPFGAASPAPATFGAAAPSPFGSLTASAPFGSAPSNSTPFGQSSNNQTPFGSSNQAPFGSSSSAAAPFGSSSTSNQSPFGSSSANQTPFGSANPAPTPFGGSASANTTTPFGASASALTPFGGGSSTFGQSASSSTPFGSSATAPISNPSPFGNSNSANTMQSPFGNSNPTTASSPFGSNTQSNNQPFGSSSSAPASAAGPFGGNNSTPFGSNSQGGGGRGYNNSSNNRGARPPCKFFAQGICSKGDSCRFSHEVSQNAPFGGPRR